MTNLNTVILCMRTVLYYGFLQVPKEFQNSSVIEISIFNLLFLSWKGLEQNFEHSFGFFFRSTGGTW